MVGDAPGDREAARKNEVLFYPILVKGEEASWREFPWAVRRLLAGEYPAYGQRMDEAFLDTQLEAIGQVSCERYPGIEINYLEDIARTDPDYIRESLAAVKEFGFEGVALCWNVMEAPVEHIEAVAELC